MIYFKVNGIDLDIPTDLKLSFQKKNILFSFDDIELNRSQGFTLPHSKVNDAFFGYAYRPDFDGGAMRVSHEATMFYSGGAERGVLSCKSVSDAGYRDWETDRKSTRLNSSHSGESRMPSSA